MRPSLLAVLGEEERVMVDIFLSSVVMKESWDPSHSIIR